MTRTLPIDERAGRGLTERPSFYPNSVAFHPRAVNKEKGNRILVLKKGAEALIRHTFVFKQKLKPAVRFTLENEGRAI